MMFHKKDEKTDNWKRLGPNRIMTIKRGKVFSESFEAVVPKRSPIKQFHIQLANNIFNIAIDMVQKEDADKLQGILKDCPGFMVEPDEERVFVEASVRSSKEVDFNQIAFLFDIVDSLLPLDRGIKNDIQNIMQSARFLSDDLKQLTDAKDYDGLIQRVIAANKLGCLYVLKDTENYFKELGKPDLISKMFTQVAPTDLNYLHVLKYQKKYKEVLQYAIANEKGELWNLAEYFKNEKQIDLAIEAYKQIPATDPHYQAAQSEIATHARHTEDDLDNSKKVAVLDGYVKANDADSIGSFLFDCMGGKGMAPNWLRTTDLKLIVLGMAEQIKASSKEPKADSKLAAQPMRMFPK